MNKNSVIFVLVILICISAIWGSFADGKRKSLETKLLETQEEFDHELKIALISGSPARFRLVRPEDKSVTEGQAGKLTYDLVNGVIEFSEQASINEGGNQISSNFLVYSLRDKIVNAQAAPDGGDKVKITFTPPETDLPEGAVDEIAEPANDENGQQTDNASAQETDEGAAP